MLVIRSTPNCHRATPLLPLQTVVFTWPCWCVQLNPGKLQHRFATALPNLYLLSVYRRRRSDGGSSWCCGASEAEEEFSQAFCAQPLALPALPSDCIEPLGMASNAGCSGLINDPGLAPWRGSKRLDCLKSNPFSWKWFFFFSLTYFALEKFVSYLSSVRSTSKVISRRDRMD